jgi:hypothetical protein
MLGLLLGCSPRGDQQIRYQEVPPPKPDEYAKLDSRLYNLAVAKNPEAYAQSADLTYKDSLVLVVIDVEDQEWVGDLKWAVEALGGHLGTGYENLIQARVPVTALLKLAKHPRVVFMRPPVRTRRGG